MQVPDEIIESNSSNFNVKNDNKVVKNIIFIAFSNLLVMISGILVGFVLPKIMSKADYGYYKIFTLYFSYIGLLHFGFIDGIYLIYAGKKYEELDKSKFRLFTRFLVFFQFFLSFLIILGSLPFIHSSYGMIFMCLGINLIFNSMMTYYQFISQVTGRFKELSFRNIIKSLLTSLSIIILTGLYYFSVISLVSYALYIIIFTCIQLLLTIWYVFTYRDITFGKSNYIRCDWKEILELFKIGIPLLVANLVSSLILTIDRQFVSIIFDIETYASYAFAYNMLSLITTVISAISTVLYPTIKTYTEEQLKNNYNRLISIICIVVTFCMGAYYPLKFIIDNFLVSYSDSLPIFRIILPGLLISSCISMIMFNYYKAMNKQGRYFIITLIILVISIVANFIAYLLFKTTISISIASVIVISIWYFIVEIFIINKFKINVLKNSLYILIIILFFYALTYFVDNVYLGCVLYFCFYFLFTFVLYFKQIKCKFLHN